MRSSKASGENVCVSWETCFVGHLGRRIRWWHYFFFTGEKRQGQVNFQNSKFSYKTCLIVQFSLITPEMYLFLRTTFRSAWSCIGSSSHLPTCLFVFNIAQPAQKYCLEILYAYYLLVVLYYASQFWDSVKIFGFIYAWFWKIEVFSFWSQNGKLSKI